MPTTQAFQGTWISASAVDFGPRPGQPSTVRMLLSDGVLRSCSTTQHWLASNGVGELGYDELASQGNSKFLYFYTVPSASNDSILTVVASDNAPSVGPTGYPIAKVIWATYIDGSGNLLAVYQVGNIFRYRRSRQILSLSAPVDAVYTQSVTSFVPETAGVIEVLAYYQSIGTRGKALLWVTGEAGVGDIGDPSNENNFTWHTWPNNATNDFGGNSRHTSIPLRSGVLSFEYQPKSSCNVGLVHASGWVDREIEANNSPRGELQPPTVTPIVPTDSQQDVAIDTNITMNITDSEEGLDTDTVVIQIARGSGGWETIWQSDSAQSGYSGSRSAITDGFRYTINPSTSFTNNQSVQVNVQAEDLVGNAADTTYTFQTIGLVSQPTILWSFNLNSVQVVAIQDALRNQQNSVGRIFSVEDLWNQFSELGSMRSMERIKGETNSSLARRVKLNAAQPTNAAYRGVINAALNDLGLSLFYAMSINPRVNSSGALIANDPYIRLDGKYIYLYSDYANDQLDYQIDYYIGAGNYERLQTIVDFVNSTLFFEAAVLSTATPTTRSCTLISQSNRINTTEVIPVSTRFHLQHKYIVNNTIYFSDREVFRTEVVSPSSLISRGQFYVDRHLGIVQSYSLPKPDTEVRYSYVDYPFRALASPMVIHGLLDDGFRTQLFQQIVTDDGTSVNQLPTPTGVDLIGELLSVRSGVYFSK